MGQDAQNAWPLRDVLGNRQMGLGPARKGFTRRHAQRCAAALRA